MENTLKKSFEIIFRKASLMLNLMGLNIFRESYSRRDMLFLSIDIPIYLYTNFYSVWHFRDDFFKVAVVLIPSTYCFQGLIKMYGMITKAEDYYLIKNIILDFYDNVKGNYPNFVNDLHKKLKICIFLIDIMMTSFVSFGVVLGLYPIFVMIYTKHPQLPFGYILPGLNPNTFPGYEINYLYQVVQTYLVVFGIAGSDGICLIFVYNGCLQLEAIILMFAELDALLDSYESNKKEIENIIKQIIKTHQIQRNYMQIIDGIYKMDYVVILFTDLIEIALVLVVYSMTNWYVGFIFLVTATVQIFLVCFLGTYMIIMHEKLEKAIYNIKWYNLDFRTQEYILLILMTAQQPINLSIGGMRQLDLNAFVQIYKTVYTFSMMLQNMNTF